MFESKDLHNLLGFNADDILNALSLSLVPHTIFLSGSIIEGYGNEESDLDVFVIHLTDVPIEETEYTYQTHTISVEYISNLRLDVENWTKDQVFNVAKRLNTCDVHDWNSCVSVDLQDILFAHRIRNGLPILFEAEFDKIQKAFDFTHLSRIIMTRQLIGYSGLVEDAAGAIMSSQYGAALLTARQAVRMAIDVLLAAHGETNIKDKWRFFKLQKLNDTKLIERYWSVELPNLSRKEEVLEFAKGALVFANEIVLQAQKL